MKAGGAAALSPLNINSSSLELAFTSFTRSPRPAEIYPIAPTAAGLFQRAENCGSFFQNSRQILQQMCHFGLKKRIHSGSNSSYSINRYPMKNLHP